MVDFYLFDKENPILDKYEFEKYGYFPTLSWTETNSWRIDMGFGSADYAEWSLIRNSVNFVKSLNIKNIHYINYDNIPDPVQYLNEFLIPMQHHDASVLKLESASDHYQTYIYSIKTDIADFIFNQIKTKDEYYTLNRDHNMFLEKVFYRYLNARTNNIYISKYKSNGNDLALHDGSDGNVLKCFLLCDDTKKLFVNFHTNCDIKSFSVVIHYNGIVKSYDITDGVAIHNENELLKRNHNEFPVEIGEYKMGEAVLIFYNGILTSEIKLDMEYEKFSKFNKIVFKNKQ